MDTKEISTIEISRNDRTWQEHLQQALLSGPVKLKIDRAMPDEDVVQRLNITSKLTQCQNLIELDFSYCSMDDSLAEALAQATHLQYLADLNLEYNRIDSEGLCALLQATHFQHLRSLNLSYNRIVGAGSRVYSKASPLQHLESLNLSHNGIDYKACHALAQVADLQYLTSLSLSYNQIDDEGVQVLAGLYHLPNHLKSLSLEILEPLNLRHLKSVCPRGLKHVEFLALNSNQIGDKGAKALADAIHLQHLTHLDLSRNKIGAEGAKALAYASHLQHLTHLDLSRNKIGAEGAKALAQTPYLQHLTHLNLKVNQIGAEGAQALADSTYLSDDVHVDISENGNSLAFSSGKLQKLRQLLRIEKVARKVPDRLRRVMLIGPPYGGKTTLFKALSGRFTGFDSQQIRTQGFSAQVISMNDVQHERELIPIDTGTRAQTFELDLWDLGGHSLQRVLHRLFFKGDVYFLLVLNQDAPEQQVAIRAWLEPLVFLKGQGVLNPKALVPVKNPHLTTLKDCATTLEDRDIKPILDPYKDALTLHKPIGVPVIFDNDGSSPAFDLDFQLWPTLRFLISQEQPKERWQVLDELANLIKDWPEPLLTSSAFYEKVEADTEVQSVLNQFYPQVPDLTPAGFMDTLITYLDHAGIIRWLKPVDMVVLKPEWVCLGFYALLPPEPFASADEDQLVPEQVKRFREKLQSPDSTAHGLPGVFDRNTALDMLTALSYATPAGSKHFTLSEAQNLFKILCSPELGLVVDLERVDARFRQHFFIPLYLDQGRTFDNKATDRITSSDHSSEQPNSLAESNDTLAEHLIRSYQQASACYVIDSSYWPEYILYQLLVALWPGNTSHGVMGDQDTNRRHDTLQTSTNLDELHDRRILLKASNGQESFELIFFENRLWCFAYSQKDISPEFVVERIRDIKRKLQNLIIRQSREPDDRLMKRYIPCPDCMAVVIACASEQKTATAYHKLRALTPERGMFTALDLEKEPTRAFSCQHKEGRHDQTYNGLYSNSDSEIKRPAASASFGPEVDSESGSNALPIEVQTLLAIREIASAFSHVFKLEGVTDKGGNKWSPTTIRKIRQADNDTLTKMRLDPAPIFVEYLKEHHPKLVRIILGSTQDAKLPKDVPGMRKVLIKYANRIKNQ